MANRKISPGKVYLLQEPYVAITKQYPRLILTGVGPECAGELIDLDVDNIAYFEKHIWRFENDISIPMDESTM